MKKEELEQTIDLIVTSVVDLGIEKFEMLNLLEAISCHGCGESFPNCGKILRAAKLFDLVKPGPNKKDPLQLTTIGRLVMQNINTNVFGKRPCNQWQPKLES